MTSVAYSITESPNPLTHRIDEASPLEILRLLRQCDAQLFAGYLEFPGLLDEETLQTAARVAWRLSRILAEPDSGAVILSGAGTSGRLAIFCEREFNRQLRALRVPEVFTSLIAGGERAIITPVEAAEDDAATATADLERAVRAHEDRTERVKEGLYIGITAGLSAPYIAAQLGHLQTTDDWDAVLLGCNPAEQARATKPSEGPPSMREAIDRWGDSERFLLLNPVVGPEAIRGSTRMKGGSVTKLLLETIFHVALEAAGLVDDTPALEPGADGSLLPFRWRLLAYFGRYRAAMDAAYHSIADLSALVRLAGSTLRGMGHIYYLGRGTAGMLGVLDASECPPTFGADPLDVRGFIREGWSAWLGEGRDLDSLGKLYHIDQDDFEKEFLPQVGRGDLVIGVGVASLGDTTMQLLAESAARKARTAAILAIHTPTREDDLPEALDVRCVIEVPSLGFRTGTYNEAEFALKLALNAVTTGGHTLAGRVYHNRMIDLRLSNSKLYARAIRTIAELASVDEGTARTALHRAVFKTDKLSAAQERAEALEVLRAAGERRGIVPQALLIAGAGMDVSDAGRALAEDPIVRRVLENHLR